LWFNPLGKDVTMALIVKLSDDYDSNYYGPFENIDEIKEFVKKNLTEQNGTVEEEKYIYIDFPNGYGKVHRHSIGRIFALSKDNFKPLSIKDGH